MLLEILVYQQVHFKVKKCTNRYTVLEGILVGKLVDIKQRVVVETGEIVNKWVDPVNDYINNDNGYRMMSRTKAVRVFPNIPLPDALTRMELGHLYYLSRYMWANTGCLGAVKRRSFKPFNDIDLYNHVGYSSERKGKKWLSRMVELSMLRSIDVNLPDGTQERQWYINPIFFCPMFITRQSYLIWRDQIDDYIPDSVKKILFDK